MDAYVGFDTSCYTTSVAVIDAEKRLILDEREMLSVGQGKKGLRQSEGVFQHIKNLDRLGSNNIAQWGDIKPVAIAASVKPRPVADSYMPVFTVGSSVARVAATVAGVPFFETTHQENHLMAGLWSAKGPGSERFLTAHVSGGTTELLETLRRGTKFSIKKVGGTQDISAGQFIDRIGVAMGLPFPSGPQLEKLVDNSPGGIHPVAELRCFTKGTSISFSGPETGAKGLLKSGMQKDDVATAVILSIAHGLSRIIDTACRRLGLRDALMVGGVSSNTYIKKYLKENLKYNLYFPEKQYCSDNAVGAALIAFERHKEI